MNWLTYTIDAIRGFVTLGGPVVALLLLMSVLSLAVVFYKLVQFRRFGVGRRASLEAALSAYDRGDMTGLQLSLGKSRSHLRFVFTETLDAETNDKTRLAERLAARLEDRLAQLETGFRPLDTIAQTAPLLGLFGTVLGMIEAFQNLQGAGTSVDPSLLAGGIWVALMTTAVGLAVSMPTALLLTWLESRVAGERVFADKALNMLLCPENQAQDPLHATA